MKSSRLFFALFLILLGSNLRAQWVRENGPEGATVNALVSDGKSLFAGTGAVNSFGDLFTSQDDGATWHSIGVTMPRHDVVLSVAVRHSEVWAGTGQWVYRSTDNGKTWQQTGSSLPGGRVSVLQASDSDILAAVGGQGLFRSTDDGGHWVQLGTGMLTGQIPAVIRSGSLLFAASNGKGVFRSTDNGSHWVACDTGIPLGNDRNFFALSFFRSSIFAGTLRGIYRSDDSGNHWVSARTGLPIDQSGNAFVSADSTLYVLANGWKVYKSLDMGGHWSSITDSTTPATYLALTLHRNKLYLGSQIAGVLRTERSNVQWQSVNTGITAVTVSTAIPTAFPTSGTSVLLAGTNDADYGYGWHSEDAGKNWGLYSAGTKRGIADMALFNDEMFAATSGDGIIHSSDFGASWTPTDFPLTATYTTSLCVTPRVLFAGVAGTNGIIQSINSGSSWEVPAGPIVPSFVSKVFYDGAIYAVGNLKVFRSLSEGNSWDTLSGDPVNSMQWTGFAHTTTRLINGSRSGLFESTDNAATWQAVNSPLAISRIYAIASDHDFVVAGVESSILISSDGGASWSSSHDSLPEGIALQTLSMDSQYIYAGTVGYGLWRLARNASASVAPAFGQRSEFRAEFLGDRTIAVHYGIRETSAVSFVLSDILGNTLMRLDREAETPGIIDCKITLPAGTRPGLYFLTKMESSGSAIAKILIF